jgi:zinc transport system permease protein
MSIGVLFMAKTPGYTDPSSYLFGNILLITKMDLLLLAILDLIVLFLAWLFYPQILSASFDESFARVRGVKTELVFFVLLIIIAISVVLLQTFVGLVMVIAMLTLPSGTASYMAKSLSSMMVFASVFSLLFFSLWSCLELDLRFTFWGGNRCFCRLCFFVVYPLSFYI